MCFNRPSIATSLFVFLVSDGTTMDDQPKSTVTVQLGDISGHSHFLGECAISEFGFHPGSCVSLGSNIYLLFLPFPSCKEQGYFSGLQTDRSAVSFHPPLTPWEL